MKAFMLARTTKGEDSGLFYARLFVVLTSIFTAIYSWGIITYLRNKFDKPNPEALLEQTNGDSLGATETIFTVMTSIVVAFISKAIL